MSRNESKPEKPLLERIEDLKAEMQREWEVLQSYGPGNPPSSATLLHLTITVSDE